jgi:hypothetical protein
LFEPALSRDLLMPEDWLMFYPSKIHPDFVAWFRANYDKAQASQPEDQQRYQDKHRHGRWLNVLSLPK